MADFLPLLTRAIAGLENNTSEARRALYDRARAALVAQLRNMTPPPSESEITRERLGLEEAIRKIETEIARGQRFEALGRAQAASAEAAARPAPAAPRMATDPSLPESPRPDPRAEMPRPRPSAARPTPAPPPKPEPPKPEPPRPEPHRAEASKPAPKPIAFPSREKVERFAAPDSTRQMFREAVKQAAEAPPRPAAAPAGQVVRVSREQARRQPEPMPPPEPEPPAAEPIDLPEPEPEIPAIDRGFDAAGPVDLDVAAPDAGAVREHPRDAGRDVVRQTRAALRTPPPEPEPEAEGFAEFEQAPVLRASVDDRIERARRKVAARQAAPKEKVKPKKERRPTPEDDEESTTSGRLRFWAILFSVLLVVVAAGAIGLFAASGWLGLSGPPAQVQPGPPAAPERPKIADRIASEPARPANGQAARPAQPPAAQPSAQAQAQAPAPAQALVAQRAILYEEDPGAGQQGQLLIGTIAWRSETITPAGGLPPDLAVRGEVQVPDRRLAMVFTFKRNADPALPASHTIELQFTTPSDFAFGGVSKVPGILAKRAEGQRGAPLAGLAVDVTPGFFIVGLSAIEGDLQRNVQLLKERAWIDIPIVYRNGRRAILSIEKGLPGERAFTDAFTAWGQ